MLSPVREEGTATQEHVRLATSELLESLQQSFVDLLGAKVVDEVIVIDCDLQKRTTVPQEREREKHGKQDCTSLTQAAHYTEGG